MSDEVNHPTHYTQGGVECIDAIAAATINKRGIEAVCTANAIKYLWRFEDKGSAQKDIRKAKWYLEKLLEAVESRERHAHKINQGDEYPPIHGARWESDVPAQPERERWGEIS